MVRFSQFVLQRAALRQGQSADHPDADALTAFGEHRLSVRERRDVLAHVAQCPECREVLALSSAAEGEELISPPVVAGNRKRRFGQIIWALPAALACLLLSIIWVPSLIRKFPPPPPPPLPVFHAAVQSANQVSEKPTLPIERSSQAVRKAAKVSARPKSTSRNVQIPEKPVLISPPSIVDPVTEARAMITSAPLENEDIATSAFLDQQSADQQSAAPREVAVAGVRRQKTLRMIPGTAFARLPAAHNRKRLWSLGQPAPNDTTSAGIVLTSSDDGKTWQIIHVDDRSRLYALSSEGASIWVGGVGGALFHSVDDGRHWTLVTVDDGEVRLSGTITGIDAIGENSLKLKLQSGPAWVTTDAGVHWRRE